MGFGSLGIWEILIIGIIVLVFFGPNRLPEIARSTGRALREFRRGMNEIQRELEDASGATRPSSRGRPGRPSEPTGVSPRPPSEEAASAPAAEAGGADADAGEEPEAPLDQRELFSGDEPARRGQG